MLGALVAGALVAVPGMELAIDPFNDRVPQHCRTAVQSTNHVQHQAGAPVTEQMRKQWATQAEHCYTRFLRPLLPQARSKRKLRFMDVGCGFGFYNILVSRHYKHELVDITYFDNEGSSEQDFRNTLGWHANASQMPFYSNNLGCAKEIAVAHGVPRDSIRLIRASVAALEALNGSNYDMIYSHTSWGFHYPLAPYLPAAYQALRRGGFLLVTLRSGSTKMLRPSGVVGSTKVHPEPQRRLAESFGFKCHFESTPSNIRAAYTYTCKKKCAVMVCRKGLPLQREPVSEVAVQALAAADEMKQLRKQLALAESKRGTQRRRAVQPR